MVARDERDECDEEKHVDRPLKLDDQAPITVIFPATSAGADTSREASHEGASDASTSEDEAAFNVQVHNMPGMAAQPQALAQWRPESLASSQASASPLLLDQRAVAAGQTHIIVTSQDNPEPATGRVTFGLNYDQDAGEEGDDDGQEGELRVQIHL